jgi:hypothetical protein
MKKKVIKPTLILLSLFAAIGFPGCGSNDNVLRSGKEPPAQPIVETQADLFERDLADVKAASLLDLCYS